MTRRELIWRVAGMGGYPAAFVLMRSMNLLADPPQSSAPFHLPRESGRGEKIAILGAGIAGLVSALVLQNPIGIAAGNRAAIDTEFEKWAAEVRDWPNIDATQLPGFHRRMFGGDFIFSVSREFVRGCDIPMLLMPGDDVVHPAEISADLARAPNVEVFAPWKGPRYRKAAMNRVREFLAAHRPEATMASRAAAR